jgi:hypothetical protein
MPLLARRVILIVIGAGFVLLSLTPYLPVRVLSFPFFGLFSPGFVLLELADNLVPPAVGQNLITGDREEFWFFSTIGLAIAVALSLIHCFWNRRVSRKALALTYSILLVVLLTMSSANFALGDSFLNRGAQALIDLVLLVLGLIVISMLIRLRPQSPEGAVVRAGIVFLVFLQGVALPGLFGLIGLLNGQNALSVAQAQSIKPEWISAIAAIVSAVVAVLNYQATKRNVTELGGEKKSRSADQVRHELQSVTATVSKPEKGRRLHTMHGRCRSTRPLAPLLSPIVGSYPRAGSRALSISVNVNADLKTIPEIRLERFVRNDR